jgi:hypothetical protein
MVLVAFQAATWFQRFTTRCQKPGAPVPETIGLWSGLSSTPDVRGLDQKNNLNVPGCPSRGVPLSNRKFGVWLHRDEKLEFQHAFVVLMNKSRPLEDAGEVYGFLAQFDVTEIQDKAVGREGADHVIKEHG